MRDFAPNPIKNEDNRPGFYFKVNFSSPDTYMSWKDWAEVHKRLGQELAERMREKRAVTG